MASCLRRFRRMRSAYGEALCALQPSLFRTTQADGILGLNVCNGGRDVDKPPRQGLVLRDRQKIVPIDA